MLPRWPKKMFSVFLCFPISHSLTTCLPCFTNTSLHHTVSLCISASSLCRSFLNILMPSLSVLTYTAEHLEKPSLKKPNKSCRMKRETMMWALVCLALTLLFGTVCLPPVLFASCCMYRTKSHKHFSPFLQTCFGFCFLRFQIKHMEHCSVLKSFYIYVTVQ